MAASDRPVFPDGPDARRHRITARVAGTHLDELEARVEAGEFRNLARDPIRDRRASTTMRARRTA